MTEYLNTIRIPPNDPDSEKSLLGSIIIKNEVGLEIIDDLLPEHFYYANHQVIYRAIVAMIRNNIAVDYITLKDELEKIRKLEDVGGISYIAKLGDYVSSTANIKYYANIIIEKANYRKLIHLGNDVTAKSFESKDKPAEIIDTIFTQIYDMGETKRKVKQIGADYDEKVKEVYNKGKNPEKYGGILSGFQFFDDLTGGFFKGELYAFAARPSVGKSSFALSVTLNIAKKGRKVLFYSLEMPFSMVQNRLIAMMGKINVLDLRKGTMDLRIIEKMKKYQEYIEGLPLFIDDNGAYTIENIQTQAKRMIAKEGIEIMFLDYLGLLLESKQHGNRNEQVAYMSIMAKNMAKDLNIPVVILSQLNRDYEKRPGKSTKPRLSDLRDSGAIEQDFDSVLFLYKEREGEDVQDCLIEKRGKKSKKEDDGTDFKGEGYDTEWIRFYLAKNRNGPVNDYATVRFINRYCLFDNEEE